MRADTGSGEPVFLVEGELVALGPLRRDQVSLWLRWMNDLDVTRTLGTPRLYSYEDELRFYDMSANNPSQVTFAIYERASGRHIGTTALRDLDYRFGTATFGILIGEPEFWNRGFGTETTRLVLDYAFHVIGLHNVQLRVFSITPRGVRAYEKAGFKVVGRRREAYKLGQRRYDEIIMDALATDFKSPTLERRLHAPQASANAS